jgi:hypothetical protein
MSSCVKSEELIFPRQQYNYEEHEGKKMKKTNGCKLLLNALKLIGINGCDTSSILQRHIPTHA